MTEFDVLIRRFEDLVAAVERMADEQAVSGTEFTKAVERIGETLDRILLAVRDRG